ncbi:hypothetical protein C8F04DRAFT_1096097 [Mycena alexandri]|uniref:Uncharacterized protein n=1 Tax=Mycena alexandri TaxID=1745969 RepID=A0AAD6T0Q9_9AGAR|nr:hypothetical protein C8F04DRAFT_1096097 [Mycena alexandri]
MMMNYYFSLFLSLLIFATYSFLLQLSCSVSFHARTYTKHTPHIRHDTHIRISFCLFLYSRMRTYCIIGIHPSIIFIQCSLVNLWQSIQYLHTSDMIIHDDIVLNL